MLKKIYLNELVKSVSTSSHMAHKAVLISIYWDEVVQLRNQWRCCVPSLRQQAPFTIFIVTLWGCPNVFFAHTPFAFKKSSKYNSSIAVLFDMHSNVGSSPTFCSPSKILSPPRKIVAGYVRSWSIVRLNITPMPRLVRSAPAQLWGGTMVRVDRGKVGGVEPRQNFQPPCFLHIEPQGSIKPTGFGFWTHVVFRNKSA